MIASHVRESWDWLGAWVRPGPAAGRRYTEATIYLVMTSQSPSPDPTPMDRSRSHHARRSRSFLQSPRTFLSEGNGPRMYSAATATGDSCCFVIDLLACCLHGCSCWKKRRSPSDSTIIRIRSGREWGRRARFLFLLSGAISVPCVREKVGERVGEGKLCTFQF